MPVYSYKQTVGVMDRRSGCCLWREPTNPEDRRAVAVKNSSSGTVEHVPFNIAPVVSSFWQ